MTIVLYCWLHSYTYHCCHLHQDHCALSFIQWTILCCPRILLQLEIWSSYSPVRDSHTLRHTVSNNTLSLTHAHTCGCAGCWAACAECLLPVATGNGQAVQYYCCRMDVSSPFSLFRWFVPLHGLCCTTTKNTCFVKYLETKQSLPFQKTWKVLIAKCKHVDQAHDTAHICRVICTAYILAVQTNGLVTASFYYKSLCKNWSSGSPNNERIHLSRPVQHAMAHSLSTFDCVNLCEILVELSY